MLKFTILVLAALLALPAAAADLGGSKLTPLFTPADGSRTWTGGYVGVFGTCGTGAHVASAASVSIDGLSFRGCGGGLQGGLDYQIGSWVIGVGADYEISTAETSASITFGDSTYSLSYQKQDAWTVFGRLGYLVGPNTLVYGLGGWGIVDFGDVEWTGGSAPGLQHSAWMIGAGMEHRIGRASIKIEYRHREYSEETLSIRGLPPIKDAPAEDAALIGITLRM